MKNKVNAQNIKLQPDKFDDTNGITIPITYPDRRAVDTHAAIPSDENVLRAKEWVDHNIK